MGRKACRPASKLARPRTGSPSPSTAAAMFSHPARVGRQPGQLESSCRLVTPAPDDIEAWLGLASRLKAEGHFAEAIAACARAITIQPDCARAYGMLGDVFKLTGQTDLAVGACAAVVRIAGLDAGAHSRLANALSRARRFDEAEAEHRIAYSLDPRNAAVLLNYEAMLGSVGRHREALVLVDAALALKPDLFEAIHNRAKALRGLGRLEEAITEARRAVSLRPCHPDARQNLASCLLGHGEMTGEAWDALEARHLLAGATVRGFTQPLWNGEDIAGRTILLHADEGLGDTLQFVRYAPLVAARGAHVLLEIPASLKRLFENFPGVSRLVVQGEELPDFDMQCPLMSLPRAFATTLESIPAPVPFPGRPRRDTAHPEPRGVQPLRVGLVWAGNPAFASDHLRSLTLSEFAPLWDVAGIALHSLQMGPATAQIAALPTSHPITDLMAGVRDYHDTAERIEGLDLVIAVDTSVAHLAASMGHPVWMLSRNDGCWRWLHNRSDTPWYPGMTIYRQPESNDWAQVVRTLCEDLRAILQPLTTRRDNPV